MKEQFLKCVNEFLAKFAKSSLATLLKHRHPDMFEWAMQNTSFLNKYATQSTPIALSERIYCIEHNLSDRPLCKVCKTNHVNRFNTATNEYGKWCSPKCQASDPECIEKSKQTRLKLYGNENYVGIDKSRITRSRKSNGNWHYDDFVSKTKQTKLNRHGDENYVNVDKNKQTKFDRYGDENYNNISQNKKTKLDRYGDANYNNRKQFKSTINEFSDEKRKSILDKRKQTNVLKYGVEHATQSKDVQNKYHETCMTKYGVENTFDIPYVRENAIIAVKEKAWKRLSKDIAYTPLFTYDEFIANRDPHHMWTWKCTKCGNTFDAIYDNGSHHRCYSCYPNTTCGTSLAEQQLAEYVQTLTSCKVFNRAQENKHVIDGREIDIFIPDLKLGIEYDGLYYHSEEQGKDRLYHLRKTRECANRGIRLIHIFEDEWLDQKNIVKARLKHIVSNTSKKIYARLCTIHEITNDVKSEFLEKFHIQGNDISSVRLGLFYSDELVAVMTFIKARYSKKYEWELSRYATIDDCVVIGGAGKLLKYFERSYKPKSLVTYADCRWSEGKLYYAIGFSLSHISSPNYFYVKNGIRYSRIMFQKHKQKHVLKTFDQNLSEVENMRNNGYTRIFDCGNMVFFKTYLRNEEAMG